MKPWVRWMYALAGVAVAVVVVSSAVQAVRQGSWGPIIGMGWLPAVAVAIWWPGNHRRRCLSRCSGHAG
jgi:hypothetical protein